MPGHAEPITPASTLEAALPLLRRPPAPQAVRFKALIDAGDRCELVAYTDVRFVIDQLNAVCGGNWSPAYGPLESDLSTIAWWGQNPSMSSPGSTSISLAVVAVELVAAS